MSKWKMVRLTDICDFQGGTQPPKDEWIEEEKDGYIRMLQIRDFTQDRNGKIEYVKNNNILKQCTKNDILIARYGASVGKILTGLAGAYNVAIVRTLPDESKILKIFLKNYLMSNSFQNYIKNVGSRAAQAGFNKCDLGKLTISLPPLEEQKRIADILDKASSLIDLRKQQLEKMDLLIKSKFIDMFGDPVTNHKGWGKGTIRDVVSDVKYGTSAPSVENGKYIYLRMNNITYDGHLDLSSIKYINVSDNEFEKYVVIKGDILFNRTNSKELVGKTCVFKEDVDMIIAGYIIRVRVNEKVNAEYLSAVLNSKYGKNTLFDMCKAIVGQANINAQELQNIKILIPPIELQNDFASFVEQVEKQKVVMQQSLEKMEINYKALMQEYF